MKQVCFVSDLELMISLLDRDMRVENHGKSQEGMKLSCGAR